MPETKYTYFTFGIPVDVKVAVVNRLINIQKTWALKEGISVKGNILPDAEAILSKEWGDLLTDIICNTENVIIISEKAYDFFKSEGITGDNVEYFPIAIRNKKGRLLKNTQYFLVNPLTKINCLDRDRSKFITRDDGITVLKINNLHIKEELIPDDIPLFRLGEQPTYLIYRSDFIKKMEDLGLTGFCPCPMGEQIW